MGSHTDAATCRNRRATRPLNQSAVAAANAAQPSCGSYPERKRWMDAYIAAGGAWECACPDGRAPSDPAQPCGGATPTCTITSQTVATRPANRARTRIGVGEEVRLTVSPGPAGWAITSGTGSLSPSTGRHNSVRYTAGDTAGNVTITATAASGCTCIVTLTVVAPDSWTMQRQTGTNLKHTLNRPDCGWCGTMFVHPNDVNFYNVEVRELDSQCVATGSHSGFAGVWHGSYPLPDRAGPWCTITMANHTDTDGSKVNLRDNIYSGDPGAAATGAAPPFTAGDHRFPVVWQWHVAAGTAHNFASVAQEAEIFADGRCQMRKGGNSEQTQHSDPTSAC